MCNCNPEYKAPSATPEPAKKVNNRNGEKENQQALLRGKGDIKLSFQRIPEPKPHEVVVELEVVGIADEDIDLFFGDKPDKQIKKPIVLGHEGSGTVKIVGKDVENIKVGDRVVIEPMIPCTKCPQCKVGRPNLCEKAILCGTPPKCGLFCNYYAHDARYCHVLPDNLSFEEGAMLEPLSLAVHSCKRANIQCGDVVLVFGCNPQALLNLMTAKAFGAIKVAAADINVGRLQKAWELGVDKLILLNEENHSDKMVRQIIEDLGEAPTVSIECTGVELFIEAAIKATKNGGCVLLNTLDEEEINVPLSEALPREINILGAVKYKNDFPTAIELTKNKKICLLPVVSFDFAFDEIEEAFMKAGKEDVKVQIHPKLDWRPDSKLAETRSKGTRAACC